MEITDIDGSSNVEASDLCNVQGTERKGASLTALTLKDYLWETGEYHTKFSPRTQHPNKHEREVMK